MNKIAKDQSMYDAHTIFSDYVSSFRVGLENWICLFKGPIFLYFHDSGNNADLSTGNNADLSTVHTQHTCNLQADRRMGRCREPRRQIPHAPSGYNHTPPACSPVLRRAWFMPVGPGTP